ncbi:MAG: hypothetical protein AAF250_07815 [Pseudomonadota bacterium]
MSAILLVLAAAQVASDAAATDAALNDALEFDRQAYVATCGDPEREKVFAALQVRARELNDRYVRKFLGEDAIRIRYIDRRPRQRCSVEVQFELITHDWKGALDRIEVALGGQ